MVYDESAFLTTMLFYLRSGLEFIFPPKAAEWRMLWFMLLYNIFRLAALWTSPCFTLNYSSKRLLCSSCLSTFSTVRSLRLAKILFTYMYRYPLCVFKLESLIWIFCRGLTLAESDGNEPLSVLSCYAMEPSLINTVLRSVEVPGKVILRLSLCFFLTILGSLLETASPRGLLFLLSILFCSIE